MRYAETGSHSLSDFLAKMPEAFIVLQCSPPNGSSGATQTSPVWNTCIFISANVIRSLSTESISITRTHGP